MASNNLRTKPSADSFEHVDTEPDYDYVGGDEGDVAAKPKEVNAPKHTGPTTFILDWQKRLGTKFIPDAEGNIWTVPGTKPEIKIAKSDLLDNEKRNALSGQLSRYQEEKEKK